MWAEMVFLKNIDVIVMRHSYSFVSDSALAPYPQSSTSSAIGNPTLLTSLPNTCAAFLAYDHK
jgi:hypothetical protein